MQARTGVDIQAQRALADLRLQANRQRAQAAQAVGSTERAQGVKAERSAVQQGRSAFGGPG